MKTKDNILKILAEQQDTIISGELLAEKLGVSRTAIWKAIKSLQEQGFDIKTIPQKGYSLNDGNQLNAQLIQSYLTTDMMQIELFDEVTSTNVLAKERSSQPGIQGPLLIVANSQTAGYGRFGRTFESPEDTGIYISYLLRIDQPIKDVGQLTTATAMAVSYALENKLKIQPQIKWVNDIYYQNKKVCGILTEAVTDFETQQVTSLVIGIGLDFKTDLKKLSPELQDKVGSLIDESNNVTRNELIAEITNQFIQIYQNYQNGDFMNEYRERSLVIGQTVTLKSGHQEITGTVETINDDGQLVLRDNTGQVMTYMAGEITKVNVEGLTNGTK
ncbi:biotin--[acetyl-CoA-carboxylase] ligase [Dellaglioa sp. P0083]|uniref:biotin--[acetyl-CoA-carboxylase] ligase n=1 Tax=Dellaglioa kimchii TaxID=3344667 RepID=UPI0038D47529